MEWTNKLIVKLKLATATTLLYMQNGCQRSAAHCAKLSANRVGYFALGLGSVYYHKSLASCYNFNILNCMYVHCKTKIFHFVTLMSISTSWKAT